MSEDFARIKREVSRLAPAIVKISRTIFDNPELCFKEKFAVDLLTSSLEKEGFKITRGSGRLKTAFSAEWKGKHRKPSIAILAEYDALPGIGHACGHNLIAASAFGSAVAVKEILGKECGTLKVIGTPAEEGGGGKLIMIKKGWFGNIDAAIMSHPSTVNRSVGRMLAVAELEFRFLGKASHAAAHPEKGVNALDAVIALFNGVNAMRQQMPDSGRVHGIITEGGDAPNIIPEQTAAMFMVRGLTMPEFNAAMKKLVDCARGAAISTGCRLKIKRNPLIYHPFEPNHRLGKIFARYMKFAGLEESPLPETGGMGSSDIGNLSQVVPAIHPEYAVGGPEAVNHSRAFLKSVVSKGGQANMLKATMAMAGTVGELFENPSAVKEIRKEFRSALKIP